MSIIIQNISKKYRQTGLNDYVVRINDREITRFKHKREDGLAECLRAAALAVERSRHEEVERIVQLVAQYDGKD